MSATVSFFVHGIPQPQGSARGFNRGGKVVITSANPKLGDWRRVVAGVAQDHARLFEGPVTVGLQFYLPRPKSLGKKVALPAKRPDVDKLIRSCFDALTGVMWADDSQVTTVAATKEYATTQVGVKVFISEDEPR